MVLEKGFVNTRCICWDKPQLYFDGNRAYCPLCGREGMVEYTEGKPTGVIPPGTIIL